VNRWNPHHEHEHEQDDDSWNYHYESDEEREIEIVDIDDEDVEDIEGIESEPTKNIGNTEQVEFIQNIWNTKYSEDTEDTDEVKHEKKVTRLSLAPRFSLRQRRRQLVVTAGFVALLLAVLIGGYGPTRQTLVHTFSAPVPPTSTLIPGIDRFYIAGEPPWGHLLVDGKPVMHLPDPIHSEPPLRLPRGKHVLTWIATPFPAHSCIVSVPPNYRTDSCNYDGFIQVDTLNRAWLFSFPYTLLDLPVTARESLMNTAQNTLNKGVFSETARTGEVYATSSSQHPVAVAKEPLIATLNYQLDVTDMAVNGCSEVMVIDNGDCAYNGQDCHVFCTAPQLFVSNVSSQAWDVLAVVSYKWTYKTLSGKLVASNQPDQPAGTTPKNHLIPLQITWDGMHWHVVSELSQLDPQIFSGDVGVGMEPACASAISNVEGDKSLARVLPSYYSTSWVYSSADNPAVGCVGIVKLDGGLTPTPQQTPAYMLHRFGLFIAANKIAHEYFPGIPVADAYEQQIAQQMANSYVQTQ